jgi:hypothetical protein
VYRKRSPNETTVQFQSSLFSDNQTSNLPSIYVITGKTERGIWQKGQKKRQSNGLREGERTSLLLMTDLQIYKY